MPVLDRLSNLWWVELPRRAARLSPVFGSYTADGHFLAGYPVLGSLATPAALICGLVIGCLRLGYYRSFSESLTLVILAIVFGFVATQLGAAYVLGFAVGDFVLGQHRWIYHSTGTGILDNGLLAGVVRIRIPMFIAYLLLLSLVVMLPTLIRRLLQNLPGHERLPPHLGFGIALLLNAIVGYAGVALWTAAAPILIRPLYTWSVRLTLFGVPIPPEQAIAPEAVETFQQDGVWLIRAAVLATLLRFALVYLTLTVPALRRRVAAVEAGLATTALPQRSTVADRIGPYAAAVVASGLVTLALSGMIEVWWMALLLLGEFLLLRLLSQRLIPPRMDGWRRLIGRVPLLLRLAIALLAVRNLGSALVGPSASFTPMALVIAGSLAVLYLLMPGEPAPREPA